MSRLVKSDLFSLMFDSSIGASLGGLHLTPRAAERGSIPGLLHPKSVKAGEESGVQCTYHAKAHSSNAQIIFSAKEELL